MSQKKTISQNFKISYDQHLRNLVKFNEHLSSSIHCLQDCNFPVNNSIRKNRLYISKVKIKCAVTANSRVLNSKFRLSRQIMRQYALFGLLPGVTKSIW